MGGDEERNEGEERPPYRRRYGLFYRKRGLGQTWPWGAGPTGRTHMVSIDGGEDAPMGPPDRRLFKWIVLALVLVGAVLVVLALTE